MGFFSTAAVLSLAASSLALPTVTKRAASSDACMTDGDAQLVVDSYAELIRDYSDELAEAALAVDFTDYSESVNSLINTCPQGDAAMAKTVPLLQASFTTRKMFMIGQGQQPSINFFQQNIEHNCNTVTVRWKTTNTAEIPKPRPVIGIILLEVEQKKTVDPAHPWIISTVFSEFDSAAWLQNLQQWGICGTPSPASPTLALPSGSAGAPPPPPATAAPATSAAGAPAYTPAPTPSTTVASVYSSAASSYSSSSSAAASYSSSSSAAASSYASSSSAAVSSYAASTSTAYSSSAAASSAPAAYSTATYA